LFRRAAFFILLRAANCILPEGHPMPLSRADLETKLSIPSLSEYPHRHGGSLSSYSVPGERAVTTWKNLRKIAPGLGYWPVIFGEPKNLKQFSEMIASEHAENPAEILQQAARVDIQAYFKERSEEFSGENAHGEWPKSVQGMGDFTLPRKILSPDEFHQSVDIGLVPAENSWEVPAQLTFGGWNDCPYPHEQVAVLRYWNETHGAELVGLSGDVLEMQVARRPASREDAIQLANEQYWYCYDIVEQGAGTIENLAATLLASGIWYFWWD
jgi:hypothetical protein